MLRVIVIPWRIRKCKVMIFFERNSLNGFLGVY